MKHFALLFCLSISLNLFAQTNTDNLLVTMTGIGPFKINMNKANVEKIVGHAIEPKKDEDGFGDTAVLVYKGVSFTITFYENYIDDKSTETAIFSIKTNSPMVKTKSGIGIGDDKLKIITTYPDFDFNFYFHYIDSEDGSFKRSKERSTLSLTGQDSPSIIQFYLNNGKVESFEVTIAEGC